MASFNIRKEAKQSWIGVIVGEVALMMVQHMLAKVVTSLRTKNLHKSGLISFTDTILGHSLYDLGQGTGK